MNLADGVRRVQSCDLRCLAERWAWAHDNADAIDAHWRERLATQPHFFNGVIYVGRDDAEIDGDVLRVGMFKTDFKSFLHWRESGFPTAGVIDVFGSAILQSVEGHVVLGRQAGGHINGGWLYLPGGFIDARDALPNGSIDVAGSIAREIAEETYLDMAGLTVGHGFVVTRCGPHLSIGLELRSDHTADDLRSAILVGLAADVDPELADVVVIRRLADAEGQAVPEYTRMVLAELLGA